MKQKVDLEIMVIRRFVDKTKQDRYIQFILDPKKRHKFIGDLSHFNYFKWDLFVEVHGIEEDVILKALSTNCVSKENCYIISENAEIDTATLGIKRAINETVGFGMGTILVFGEADMIYYESESMNTRFISKKVGGL